MSAQQPVDYQAIKHVLCHEHTEHVYDRHVELLQRWCEQRSQGFYVSELQDVCDILEILYARAQRMLSVYESNLCAIVGVCNKPLIEQKANELLRPAGLATYTTFLNNVVQLMWLPNLTLKVDVIALIRRVASGKLYTTDRAQRPSNQDEERPSNQGIACQLLRKSGAIATLADVFMSHAKAQLETARRFHAQVAQNTESEASSARDEISNNNPAAGIGEFSELGQSPAISGTDRSAVAVLRGELADLTDFSNIIIPTLLLLSDDEACAKVLVQHGLINAVAMLLGVVAEANKKQLADYVQILWNCCEAYDQLHLRVEGIDRTIPAEVINFHITISELVSLFVFIQHECFRKAYKAIRNEALIVLNILARTRQAVQELLRCHGVEAILTYACGAEATTQWEGFISPMASVRTFGTATDLDVEMKSLLWALIIQISTHNTHAVNLLIAESPFVQILLEYVQGSGDEAAVDSHSLAPSEARSFNVDDLSIRSPVTVRKGVDVTTQLLPTQVADIQLLAMSVLVKICHYSVAEIRRLGGVTTMLAVISDFGGQGERSSRLMVEYALIVLRCLVEQSKLVVDELVENDVVGVIMANYHERDYNARVRTLQLVVALSNSHRQQDVQSAFCDACGVQALLDGLSAYCAKTVPTAAASAGPSSDTLATSATFQPGSLTLSSIQPQLEASNSAADGAKLLASNDEVLLVAALDCFRSTVVGNQRNERAFLEANGIDDLLATFEAMPAHMRPQFLALLSDLLENSSLAAYIHGWKSILTLRSFARLLCTAWTDEESRLGCLRPDGIITDLDHPLGSHVWDAPDKQPANLSVHSPAFARLSEALQASRVASDEHNDNKDGNQACQQRDIRCVLASVLDKLGYTRLRYVQAAGITAVSQEDVPTPSSDAQSELSSTLAKALRVSSEDLALSTADKQVMVLAKRYKILREGEGWKTLQDDLSHRQIIPISADAQIMHDKLRESFQQAQAVQFEQMQLLVEGRSGLEAEEQAFFGQILQQREALEKQAMLKSKMKPARPRKVEPRRPPQANCDLSSATASSILSYD